MPTLTRTLMAAEAQLDAMIAAGLTPTLAEVVRLRDFLRDCRVEAAELEEMLPTPLILSDGRDAGR